MKKVFALLLVLALCLSLFAACSANKIENAANEQPQQTSEPTETAETGSDEQPEAAPETEEPEEPSATEDPQQVEVTIDQESAVVTNVAALKGPTAMGMVKLMSDNDQSESPAYNFTIAAAIDEITPNIVQGNFDIAAVPANVASVLYNNTDGQIDVLAVNTLGVLYLAENGDTIHSAEDLRDRTIYSSGKGATPEYALEYMLVQNGIDPEKDVTIEWKSEHSECVAALAADAAGVAMLPQPFLTTAMLKNENIRVCLNLTEEWEKLEGKTLITGVVVVRKAFADEHPQAVAQFLADYEKSVAFVTGNTDEAAALVGGYDIVPEAVAKKALPECNITFIAGDAMKQALSSYLQTLYDQNPKSVGGAMPGDDFYYGAE